MCDINKPANMALLLFWFVSLLFPRFPRGLKERELKFLKTTCTFYVYISVRVNGKSKQCNVITSRWYI